MLLVALKPHGFAGVNIKIGQEYEAEKPFAIALVGAGVSRYVETKSAPQYETKENVVESPGEKPPAKKRHYRRKDFTPKD